MINYRLICECYAYIIAEKYICIVLNLLTSNPKIHRSETVDIMECDGEFMSKPISMLIAPI